MSEMTKKVGGQAERFGTLRSIGRANLRGEIATNESCIRALGENDLCGFAKTVRAVERPTSAIAGNGRLSNGRR